MLNDSMGRKIVIACPKCNSAIDRFKLKDVSNNIWSGLCLNCGIVTDKTYLELTMTNMKLPEGYVLSCI